MDRNKRHNEQDWHAADRPVTATATAASPAAPRRLGPYLLALVQTPGWMLLTAVVLLPLLGFPRPAEVFFALPILLAMSPAFALGSLAAAWVVRRFPEAHPAFRGLAMVLIGSLVTGAAVGLGAAWFSGRPDWAELTLAVAGAALATGVIGAPILWPWGWWCGGRLMAAPPAVPGWQDQPSRNRQ